MARFKIARFCTQGIVDRIFAAFICITLLGVALRYCWFGKLPHNLSVWSRDTTF